MHKISGKINFKLDILILGEGDIVFKNRISKLNGKKSFIFFKSQEFSVWLFYKWMCTGGHYTPPPTIMKYTGLPSKDETKDLT